MKTTQSQDLIAAWNHAQQREQFPSFWGFVGFAWLASVAVLCCMVFLFSF
jgi:hypothetical protein